jgi:hypothetical protein
VYVRALRGILCVVLMFFWVYEESTLRGGG